MKRTVLSLSPLVLSMVACFGTAPTTIQYAAQPDRIPDPISEVKSIILANTVGGCVATPEFSSVMLVVKFVCSRGVGNSVLRFDRVRVIELQQSGEWYGAIVRHSDNTPDFRWTSRNIEDMKRLVDAFSVLSKRPASAPVTKPKGI